MIASNVESVKVLEEKRPVRGVQRLRVDVGRLQLEADLSLDLADGLFVLLLLLVLARGGRVGHYFSHFVGSKDELLINLGIFSFFRCGLSN